MKIKHLISVICIAVILAAAACTKESNMDKPDPGNPSTEKPFKATPYPAIVPPPGLFAPMKVPADNPTTVEGVALGRQLFYDPILSENNTISCSSCHNIANAFTDNDKALSTGTQGQTGTRNAMPIFNLGWVANYAEDEHRFFWDGGASDLESQVLGPLTNPVEMNEKIDRVVSRLQANPAYRALFKKAFGTDTVTSKRMMQAIAQFERIIVSGNSKYDRTVVLQKNPGLLTLQERNGMEIFNNSNKGDCFHCHNLASPLTTDFAMKNNGIRGGGDEGLKRITGKAEDAGKFKTPSLRNLVFTAPYMHDGRFKTLEEVVEFYNSGASRDFPTDENIRSHPDGLQLSSDEKSDLIAFLKTLTDSSFISNPAYTKP